MYLTRRMQIFFWVFILFLFCSFFFWLKKENKVQLGKRNVSLSDVVVVCSLLALRRAKEGETARSIVKLCKLNHNYIYLKLFMHNTQLMKPKAQRKISTIDIIFVFAICMKSVENMCEDIGREWTGDKKADTGSATKKETQSNYRVCILWLTIE